MRTPQFSAVLTLILLAPTLYADELLPEWLPVPPPLRQPFWDVDRDELHASPGQEFIRLLEIRPGEENDANWRPLAGRMKLTREATMEAARWRSNLEMPDHRELREVPALSRDWKAEESLNLPIQESLFMYGQFDSGGDVDHTQHRVKGKTGFGWKCAPFAGSELQVRTGPTVKYEDVAQLRPTERSQLSVELQAKLALLGPLQLQYAGEALPAFAQADRHTLLQDLKLALPFGTNRELNVGAKYRWEDTLAQTPWMQRAEIYMGFKFQR